MKRTYFYSIVLTLVSMCLQLGVHADNASKNEFNPINTGVTSLSITPDSRGASLGDLGEATDPAGNSHFWNHSHYAFANSQAVAARQ